MSIYKKLFEAKKEIGKISKDSTNPFYKSKYFDINQLLEHVEPILQKHGLLLLQPIENNCVTTTIIDYEAEQADNTNAVISILELTNQTDPQKRGSEITYYRRYTLASLLGMQAEDDDGNTASKSTKVERKESLTTEQFQKAKNATKDQIINVLGKFRMTPEQRNTLTRISQVQKTVEA